MHIVVIAWIYVVLMMSIAEHSVVAGIMTFLLYGVLPLTIILYLMGSPSRKRRRQAGQNAAKVSTPILQEQPPSVENASDTGPRQ